MKTFNLLHYVESCTPKVKKFKTVEAMESFVIKFHKKHPDPKRNSDNWVDFAVTNVSGKFKAYAAHYKRR